MLVLEQELTELRLRWKNGSGAMRKHIEAIAKPKRKELISLQKRIAKNGQTQNKLI